MDFRANDPGAVQFGNFINYYQFNSAEDRIALLPDHVWLPTSDTKDDSPYYILDVGSNAGRISQLLLEFVSKSTHRKVYILGVDIDVNLIERAILENEYPLQIEFQCVNVMDEKDFQAINRYMDEQSIEKFDAVCCFSITMWIHLNNHDSGLQTFLQKCSSIAKLFVVEPQPWKCYRTAVRRMKRSAQECFPNFPDLQWRTDVEDKIQEYLQNELKRVKVHETGQTKWLRKICFYR